MMNSEELAHGPQEQIEAESVMLIIAAAAGLTGLAFLLLKKFTGGKIKRAEPPPIFIKSGSFVIESDIDLDEPSGGSPFHYGRPGFGAIKMVRVFKYNEILGTPGVAFPYSGTSLVVHIWLQRLVNGQWGSMTTNPDIIVRSVGNDFDLELKFAKRLDKRKKQHKTRKAKYEDKEDDIFRFGKIEVVGQNPLVMTTDEGDEYTIGFYNRVV